jgi:hypothetical protein
MLKHIVMWKLKEHAEGADRATNAAKMKAMLDACAGIVRGILKLEAVVASRVWKRPTMCCCTPNLLIRRHWTPTSTIPNMWH